MADPLLPVGDGHTALTDEDREGLRLSYITTRGELNDAEQRNITSALVRRRPPGIQQLLDDAYLRGLHRAMFGDVWKWAGRYRLRETNLGVNPTHIPINVRDLVDDARTWIEHSTFEPDELTVRFHHRLVAVHPFVNGNGRHGRVAANFLIHALGRPAFTWGARTPRSTPDLRAAYLGALRAADAHDIGPLVAFARS
jgi:Fic-DOC domain mobile mystery protein B